MVLLVPLEPTALGEAGEEASGIKEFLTLERRDVTMAYDDWSSSSSCRKLKDVRLVTSSAALVVVLLRERLTGLPIPDITGEDAWELVMMKKTDRDTLS